MSYTKQTWDTTSYVNPTRMNHIEDGIKENSDNINSPAFTEAQTRANINSGESLFTILGKIKKFFTDLKAVAFSGSASDVVMSDGVTSVEEAIEEATDKRVLFVDVPIGNVAITNTGEFANTGFYYAEVNATNYVPTGYEAVSVGIYGNWTAVSFVPKGRGFIILSAKPYTLPASRTARVWYRKV